MPYNNYQRGNGNRYNRPGNNNMYVDLSVKDEHGAVLNFNATWITSGADQGMIDYTKAAGKQMKDGNLTTSKIRNIFGEIKRIQIGGYEKNKSSFLLLQPKVAYIVGREAKANRGDTGIKIFQNIFEKAAKCVTDEKSYQNFCNLMEALVAYHKFFGGKD